MKKKKNIPKDNAPQVTSINRIVVLLVLVVLVSSLTTIIVLKNFSKDVPHEIKRLPYDFKVTENVSFVLDTDALHFGGGPNGARLQRGLNITTSQDARVHISWDGEGDIIVSENNFYLLADQTKDLLFYLNIPLDLANGTYSGELIFEFYR